MSSQQSDDALITGPPERVLAGLVDDVVRSSSEWHILVPQVLRAIRLSTRAQCVEYFRRSDDGDYLIVEGHDSRDPADTLELAQQSHPLTPAEVPTYRAFWDAITAVRGPSLLNFADPADRARLLPSALPWHDRFGIRWAFCCPLFAGNRAIGFLGVRTDDPAGFDEPTRWAVQRLADRLALAVTVETLTRKVVETTALRERQAAAERRAESFAEANEALRRSIARLADSRDVSAFLEHILREAMLLVGDSLIAQLFLYDPVASTLSPSLGVDSDRTVLPEPGLMAGLPVGEPFPANVTPAWPLMVRERRTLVFELNRDAAMFWPGTLDWHRERGHQGVLCVAMMVGDEPVGMLGLGYKPRSAFDPAELEFVQSVGQQAALAIQTHRLSEQAKQAAVARERQEAAEQRAQELAAINASLARSLSAVSGSTDFDQILDVVFHEVVRTAAASTGFLFVYDPVANTLTTRTWIDERGSGQGCYPDAPPLLAGPFNADVTPAFRQCVQAKRLLGVVDHRNLSPEVRDLLWPGVIDWHLAHGRAASCAIPVMCGDLPLGMIGLSWQDVVQFTRSQEELLFALTNQVAIVLQLSEVADVRRAAVVAQERQAAAEASAEQLARRDQLLSAAAQCAEILAQPGTLAENIPSALRYLLDAEGISRVTLMRNDRLADGSWAMFLEHECVLAGFPTQQDVPGAFPARFADYAAVVDMLSRGEVVNEFVDYLESPAADIQNSLGVKSGLQIPLFIGETWWGTLAFDNCVERRVWSEAEVQVLRNAAAGIVSVIKREQAEEELQAVAVQAAEAQAAELMAMNKLLVGSLESFTADLDTDAFITLVLERLAGVLSVTIVELWFARPGERTVFPGPLYHGGRVWHPNESGHPMQTSGFPVPSTYELAHAAASNRQIICDRISQHPQIPRHMSDWYLGRFGVDKMINLPLVVGHSVIGAVIGFAPAGHSHTESQLELGHALAGQLALAIQLRELSERAKALAVLEAQERAAQERAAALDQLNQVLVRGAERVAAAGDPQGVLVEFLREAKEVTGAFCGAVYQRIEGTRHAPLAVVIAGRVLSAAEVAASPVFARVEEWTAVDPGGRLAKLAIGEPQYIPVSECEPCLYPELTEYHQSVGNVAAWYLPLVLGEYYLGYIALGIQRSEPPTETESQLLDAVRHHLTLAFELYRLTDRERQAAVLAERGRLARDIHDTLAQGFLGILLQLEAARLSLATAPSRAEAAISSARDLAQTSLADARRSVGILRAAAADPEDVSTRLARMVAAADRGEPQVVYESSLPICTLPPDVAEQVVRIAAEAVQNARRHAQATRVVVSLSRAGGAVRVAVADDGVGFDPTTPAAGHYGLVGMRERATSGGCDLSIDSHPGRGTRVEVTWPAKKN